MLYIVLAILAILTAQIWALPFIGLVYLLNKVKSSNN